MNKQARRVLTALFGNGGSGELLVSRGRTVLILAAVLVVVLGIAARLFYVMIYDPGWLIAKGNDRIVRIKKDSQKRGMILDRNGEQLAVSVPAYSVSLYRKSFHEALRKPAVRAAMEDKLKELACHVCDCGDPAAPGPARDECYRNMRRKIFSSDRGEIVLAKEVDSFALSRIRELAIPGVNQSQILHRYYPTAEVNAHLIGRTDIDGIGTEGIEKQFNDYLLSVPGKQRFKKDNENNFIENVGTVLEEKKAGDLFLSIDERLQLKAYTALKYAVEINQATSGTLVLIDAWTGEILAMVNSPSYNPNSLESYESRKARNRAVTDSYEPGSTTKPLIAMGALARKTVGWDDVFDCRPFEVNGKRISDSHKMASGNLREIIRFSSNIGMARVALTMKAGEIVDTLAAFGYGSRTNLGLIGESPGFLPKIRSKGRISDIERATMGYGYRIRATPLQIAQAYSIFANRGVRKPLSITKVSAPPAGTRVLNAAETARMLEALESVVEGGGTGTLARIPGYRVGGKTGTAKVAESGGYGKSYLASFVGIAPMSNPRFAMAVVIFEPHAGKFFGGTVAGPVFADVMGRVLELYNVPPDDLNPDGSMKTLRDKDRAALAAAKAAGAGRG